MATCKLCGRNCKFINAHAIPEAFFRKLRLDGKPPLLVSGRLGHFTKKAPIGVYDDGILCDVCEAKFGSLDNFGINVFLNDFDQLFQHLNQDGTSAGFQTMEVDPSRLLQFLVAVLWRAAVSTHPFYSEVNLGPFEPMARLAVDTPGHALSGVFDAVISRWGDEDDRVPTTAILNPHREKWFGVNAYRLYFGKIVAYIKVDTRPFPKQLKAVSLRSAPPVFVVARNMTESKDFRAMKHNVQKAEENKLAHQKQKQRRGRTA